MWEKTRRDGSLRRVLRQFQSGVVRRHHIPVPADSCMACGQAIEPGQKKVGTVVESGGVTLYHAECHALLRHYAPAAPSTDTRRWSHTLD